MKKRLLSIVLTIALVFSSFSCLSLNAFALEGITGTTLWHLQSISVKANEGIVNFEIAIDTSNYSSATIRMMVLDEQTWVDNGYGENIGDEDNPQYTVANAPAPDSMVCKINTKWENTDINEGKLTYTTTANELSYPEKYKVYYYTEDNSSDDAAFYEFALDAQGNIAKDPAKAVVENTTFTYNGSVQTPTITSVKAGAEGNGDNITGYTVTYKNGEGTVANPTDAGTYTYEITHDDYDITDGTGSFTINPSPITVTDWGSITPNAKTYDTTTTVDTANSQITAPTFSGIVSGENTDGKLVNVTYEWASADAGEGEIKISASLNSSHADAKNYTMTAASQNVTAGGSVTIQKADYTGSISGYIPIGETIVGYQFDGKLKDVNDADVSGSFTVTAVTETADNAEEGQTYNVTASFTAAEENNNYNKTVTGITGTLECKSRTEKTAAFDIASGIVYSGNNSYKAEASIDGLTSNDYTVTYIDKDNGDAVLSAKPTDAGNYAVKIALTDEAAKTYKLTGDTEKTFEIKPYTVTVEPKQAISKPYDGTKSTSITADDLKLADGTPGTVSIVSIGNAEYNDTTVAGANNIIIGTVTLSDTKNYTLPEEVSVDATITALEIEATLKREKASKVYGNEMSLAIEDFTFNTSATNLETELAGLAFTSDALTATANAGEYGITVTQPTSGNYNVTTDSKITVTALPVTITVTPVTPNKTYTGTAFANADLVTVTVKDGDNNDVTVPLKYAYTKDGAAAETVTDAGTYSLAVTIDTTATNYTYTTTAPDAVEVTVEKADYTAPAAVESIIAIGTAVENFEIAGEVTAADGTTKVPGKFVITDTDKGSAEANKTYENLSWKFVPTTADENYNVLTGINGKLTAADKADNTQKPAVTPVNAATVGGNGQLVIKKADDDTVTSDTAVVEYKPASDTDWTQATLTDGTVTVDVPAGTYEVRYAETDTTKAGASVQAVVSDAAENTNTPDVTATAPTTLDGKGTLTIAKKADDTVTSDTAPVQYRVKGTEDWTDTVLTDGTVTVDAASGTYEVRYGATEGFAPGTIVEADVPAVVTYKITATPTDENSHGTYTYTVGDGEPATADTAKVIPGTLVKVTATPDSSYKVSKITLTDPDGKTTTVSTTKSEFTMPENDVTISVTFAKKSSGGGGGVSSYTVKYDVGENGKITSGKASESVVSSAKPKNVPEVTANDGYKFVGWSQDGTTIVDPTTVSVTKAITFTAVYEEAGEATPTPTPTAKPQGDTDNHEHYINGYEDGTFRAEDTITRAEVATIFALAISDYDETQTYASEYSDLDANEWYANYVSYLSGIGAITGYEDGTFRAQQSITRQEFATMIARLGEVLEAGEMPFADVSEENWGVDYIYTTYANGWVSGYEDGTFRPENPITRAEAVKIVNGYLGRGTDEAGLADADYTVFPDVETSHWAYFDIIEAANDHTFTKDTMPEIWVD